MKIHIHTFTLFFGIVESEFALSVCEFSLWTGCLPAWSEENVSGSIFFVTCWDRFQTVFFSVVALVVLLKLPSETQFVFQWRVSEILCTRTCVCYRTMVSRTWWTRTSSIFTSQRKPVWSWQPMPSQRYCASIRYCCFPRAQRLVCTSTILISSDVFIGLLTFAGCFCVPACTV